ncbi:DUF7282 domain-containing protein [Halobaculum marinum]|uniref:PGF-CTERM sorting domain-containing protein n=1 Tax=Halobaculum marinum TaxID=3031996 RepID=A0ABD5WVF3_9EURY|nr:PGF-CTERM sorting domain-containing protein [Halobaculum sp. DT55]
MNARTTLPALVLLSVLVGAVALAGGLAAGTATAQTANDTANATADITFEDQVGVEEVTVDEVTLSEGGFLAVYNASNGLVGHTEYLEAGTHENLTVEVSPALSRSQVVVAKAHLNEGDQTFNASVDDSYTDENGQDVADTAYVADEEFTRTTATDTATTTATDAAESTTVADTESSTETSGPGFSAVAALVALVGAALLARR